jgi:bifunctional DNA-binding transcriptional regulator/antitoxin component of YhaV-PrlF toxin-antitoxin module
MIKEMKTISITKKGQIAIPLEVRKTLFKTGSKAVLIAFEDHLEIRPLEQVYPALMSEKSLAKDWLSKEEEKAWKNL